MKLLGYLFLFVLPILPMYAKQDKEQTCNFTATFYGTLLEFPTVNNLPGQVTLDPYLFGGFSYGSYDNNWSLVKEDRFGLINSQFFTYIGVLSWLEFNFFLQSQTVFLNDRSSTHFGDSTFALGFQFLWEEKNTPKPNVRIAITETFPTGKYKNLDPFFNGIDSTGAGAYGTSLIFVVSKTFYNNPCHPFNIAINLSYTYLTKTRIKGLNTYGGGPITDGVIAPGMPLLIDFSTEYCFSEKYLFALDIQYTHTFPASFHGFEGFAPDGTLTSVSTVSKDLLTITPAIEFGITPNVCIYLGGYFTIAGRNASASAEGNISLEATF